MNQHPVPLSAAGLTRREGLLALLGGAVALTTGCGGGGSDGGGLAGVTSGGTGSLSTGSITGFGSVIVNGVRYDDSAARVSDDDDNVRASGDLKLGMVVTITGTTAASGTTGTAQTISYGSELIGPVSALDLTARTLTVLGQTVKVTASTIFEEGLTAGLGAIAVNDVIEVHGFVDPATNTLSATRIERKAGATAWKLAGAVARLDATAKTFQIGTLAIGYAGVQDLPAGLANGLLVRVRLQTAVGAGSTWVATRVRALTPGVKDYDAAEVEGKITAFTSAWAFSVNGMPVDASSATFPDGKPTKVGDKVEIKGAVRNGVLVAVRVQMESEDDASGGTEFELHGSIDSVDTVQKTFVLRGSTVSYAGSVSYSGGTQAGLVKGAKVEVKGLGAATLITATRIQFES